MHTRQHPAAHFARTKISLKTKGVTCTDVLGEHVRRSLHTSLGRFGRRMRQIAVWLEDVNGPRGGIDTRCRIDVRLHPRGRIPVGADAPNEYAAVTKAANRARTLLDRKYKKARTLRRSASHRD